MRSKILLSVAATAILTLGANGAEQNSAETNSINSASVNSEMPNSAAKNSTSSPAAQNSDHTLFYVAAATPLLNKAGGKEIALLHVGAKVHVLKEAGEYVQVEYSGFVPEGSTQSYARLGVLEQDLTDAKTGTLKTIKKVKDDYDNEWINASVRGYVAKVALKKDIGEIYAAGEALFKERCGGCHALHGYDEFGANVWPSVVETMIQNSGLEPNEYETLVRFLQSKAPVE